MGSARNVAGRTSFRAAARNPRDSRKFELNGGSVAYVAVGSAHMANRSDGLRCRVRGGEVKFQLYNFSDTPLPWHFNEHPAGAEID
jgi:hypothetical protein